MQWLCKPYSDPKGREPFFSSITQQVEAHFTVKKKKNMLCVGASNKTNYNYKKLNHRFSLFPGKLDFME